MKLKVYVISVETPTWLRNVVAVGAAAAFAAVARGDVPNKFMPNTPIKSAEVNANFAYLESEITYTNAGGLSGHNSVSTGGSFCGASAMEDGMAVGGYGKGKQTCETTCKDSPTAHMCSSEEISRYVQTGGTFTFASGSGWVATATLATYMGANVNDCSGYTTNLVGAYGQVWQSTPAPGTPTVATCNQLHEIACCD